MKIGIVAHKSDLDDFRIGVTFLGNPADDSMESPIRYYDCFSSEHLENYDIGDRVWILANGDLSVGFVISRIGLSLTDGWKNRETDGKKDLPVAYDGNAVRLFQEYLKKALPGFNANIGMLKMLYCDENMFLMLDKMSLKYVIFYPFKPGVVFYMDPNRMALCNMESSIILGDKFIDITAPRVNINSPDINLGKNPSGQVCTLPKGAGKGLDPMPSDYAKA